MTVKFRNVDASPDDDVQTWPFEALVTVIERGLVPDWKPVLDEIRRSPWGSVARRVERYLSSRAPDADRAGTLFALAIENARRKEELADRSEVAERVRKAVASTGLTNAEFANLIGTSASRLSTYRSGKVVPSAAMLIRIERATARIASESAEHES
ncbi:MAG: XRE family transcriptional regulator [Acidobacteria bacterium]|nr:MAG: XRE family transcriptional regulator [Acidobacteriota bacterium]